MKAVEYLNDSMLNIYRLFCDLDSFMKILLAKLKVSVSFELDMLSNVMMRSKVPYDEDGYLSQEKETVLDLSQGQEVVTSCGKVGRVMRYCSTQTAWEIKCQECPVSVKMVTQF